MAKVTKYFLCVRPGNPVGPHKIDSLREWVEIGAISPDWRVCKEGEDSWVKVADIPKFYEFPPKLRERFDRYRNRPIERWWSDPATEKQLKKLRFFEIPFNASGLTKGRASELIDAFVTIDPVREEQYESSPASASQAEEIRSLGGNPEDLTYSEARDEIEELKFEREE